jgi:hypothetical protein
MSRYFFFSKELFSLDYLLKFFKGDSGGGLIVRPVIGMSRKNEVVGIVSYGEGCARKNKPG